jgi:hypothetical protein
MAQKPKSQVNTWEDKLAAAAQAASSSEAAVSVGSFISTRGGRLSLNDNPFPNNELDCIVIDFIAENTYYDGDYDPDTPQSPACFAFWRGEDIVTPHEKSVTPQSEDCASCPMNQFGSADRGKGKACKNVRRLALIALDQLDNVAETVPTYLRVPVTSVKNWATYVKNLASAVKRPPYAVITRVALVPDPKTQFKLTFKMVELITDEDQLTALSEKQEQVAETIGFPYLPVVAEEKPKKANAKLRGK